MFNIRREQGRLAEVEGAVRGFIELYPAIPAWRGALALLLIELGRPDEARAEFEQAAEGGFAAFPRDANWLIAITLMAEVCGALGDAARAEELYNLLEPYAGNNVVVGRNATNYGNASRLLGLLAATRGKDVLAERHYGQAQKMHAKMGAKPMYARTQVSYAELLLARRAPGDLKRARELLADAIVDADALGMIVLAERARRLVPLPV
jgi:tetratricopeptide (TPR) repeat protein